ncbi:MAG: pilus assembly PilX N-terminal domain-containing protein [Candidatus Aenigmarchaeota archaeon]|nr:pilus assembly PilX N-terminal domain-containing protein [Candidatus Aenigmarchaeota archaeon]
MKQRSDERGTVLILAILLVIVLSMSGASFLHLHFLEMRMATNEVSNHAGFYLANTGIERARETFKLPNGQTNWSKVLDGTYDSLDDADTAPDYPADSSPVFCPTCLCGPNSANGCVIPSFQTTAKNPAFAADGDPVTSSTDTPLAGIFFNSLYSVRAFNNDGTGDLGTTDGDQKMTIRALGNVRGEQKLIEATIIAGVKDNLITCGDPVCPEKAKTGHKADCDETTTPKCSAIEGHEPATSLLPTLDHPLTDSNNYYRNVNNFNNPPEPLESLSLINRTPIPLPCPATGKKEVDLNSLQNNSYYFINCDVTVQGAPGVTYDNIVIFSTGNVSVTSGNALTHAIIIGTTGVQFNGNGELHAPRPYPAVISQGNVSNSSGSATVYGNIYASAPPPGTAIVEVNPVSVYGLVYGDRVQIQGSSIYSDENNIEYYQQMPGFIYSRNQQTTNVVAGTWKEIQ